MAKHLRHFAALRGRAVAAQAFPTRPLRLVVAFPAGGGADVLARALAQKLAGPLGQPVVVENRVGASGIVGSDFVAKSPPDGHTLLMVSTTQAIASRLLAKVPFDLARSFAPVAFIGTAPLVLVVHPAVPARTMRELIEISKTRKLNYAPAASGTVGHLSMEMLKSMAQFEMLHVPYKGTAPATTDLLGGQVDAMLDILLNAMPHLKALARLRVDQCRWLLSYTGQQASGVSCWMRDPDHVEKAFVLGGMTARNAVYAATMVEAGMTGVDDVFAGTPNLFSAYAPEASLAGLASGLGQSHEIMRANIKKWSVGSPVQAALDSIDALMHEQGLCAEEVVRIEVQVRDDEAGIVNNRDAPNICLQHLIALMLVDRGLTFETSHDASRMKEPRIRRLRKLIHFEGSRALREAGGRQALVAVITRSGRLGHHTRAVRGAADNPMTDQEVDAKCAGLLGPVLGARKARRLADAIWDIERVKDVVALRPLLRSG